MAQNKEKIITVANNYNFYAEHIPRALDKWVNAVFDWGFMIYGTNYYADNMVNIEYIFVLPAYRRKGILTQLIQGLKTDFEIISFTSSQESMKCFAQKNAFHDGGICRCKVDTFYIWSNTYSKQELMSLY